MPSLDRTLKLLWLAIGALLMLFLLAGGVMVVSQVIRNAGAGDAAVRIAREAPPPREEPRAVRYTVPSPIRGTSTQVALVSYGTGYTPAAAEGAGYASGRRMSGAEVNVMFVDSVGVRLLLDRPAYVRRVDYPMPRQDASPALGDARPAARRWIAYELALDDTNGNGQPDPHDAASLYLTDLDGRNLRPVLRPPLRYLSYSALDAGRILVYALEPPRGAAVDEERMRQRAFIYDMVSGQLSPFAAMDSVAERAGQILRR